MNDFILYLKMGLFHVLDFTAYDHILFLIVLTCVFNFNQWKKIVWLVTLFTIGHSITLALSAFKMINVNAGLVEFLIPLTIFITGFVNIITVKNSTKLIKNNNLFFAFFFGLIHGLGFSNYFKLMIGKTDDKIFPLIEFAVGIEIAQLIIVLAILVIAYLIQNIFNVNRRDWVIVISAMVVGFASQMMIDRVFW